MRRVLVLLLLSTVVAVACAGGDKAPTEGQADYLERVMDFNANLRRAERESNCEALLGSRPQDCDVETFVKRFEQEVDRFGDLKPPPELAAHHRRAVQAFRAGMQVIGVPTEEVVARAREIPELATANLALQEWWDALQEHFGVDLFTFEGASMAPTFEDGDTVALEPFAGQVVERWTIVAFAFHLDPERDFIKRIVALPGETIEIRNGTIYIDGREVEGDVYAEKPPNYEYGPKTVPAGHYFVLGDNRRNSFDSHAWGMNCPPEQMCDFVPEENIIGVLPADTKGPQDD